METELTVALLAAVAALCSAAFTGIMAARQSRSEREFKARTDAELEKLRHELSSAFRQEDRSLRAREVLDRYRRPLLGSAVQLARRIENIRHRSFLLYLKADEHRAEVALRSILYRFAAYLGWRESLNRELTYLHFKDNVQTKHVLGLLDDLRAKISSSRFDIVEGQPRLMLWTDEQAAIGGLMLRTDGSPGVIGFESFFQQYDETFAPWLTSFAADLQRPGIETSTRLREIADVLDILIKELDVEEVFGEHPHRAGGWQRADASRESRPRATRPAAE